MESKSIQQLNLILLTLEDIDASITHLKNWNAGVQDFLAFAAILERCSIMETKEQQVRESQAWRAARETQGTIIIHDPKYM